MNVTWHIDKHLPASIGDVISHHADTRLSRFAPLITTAHATVVDENGPRGGVDIYCYLAITLKRGVKVQIRSRAATVGEAVTNAFARASRTVARRLDRVRTARRAGAGIRPGVLLASQET